MVTEGMLEELVVKVITPDSDIGAMVSYIFTYRDSRTILML